jgi:hypothetical protein
MASDVIVKGLRLGIGLSWIDTFLGPSKTTAFIVLASDMMLDSLILYNERIFLYRRVVSMICYSLGSHVSNLLSPTDLRNLWDVHGLLIVPRSAIISYFYAFPRGHMRAVDDLCGRGFPSARAGSGLCSSVLCSG